MNCDSRNVTVQEPLFREVFWHEYAKIPRVARKNPIAEGDFWWIFDRNCEDIEQLHRNKQIWTGGSI